MLRLKHILFPYDFSERCGATAPLVAEMARRFQARVTLFTAIPPIWQNSRAEPKAAATLFNPQRLQKALDEALKEQLDGLRVDRLWQKGDPATLITDFTHSKRVDLVMMPTHGFGPFRTLLLGSVTAKVLNDVRCPVWTAAHNEEDPAGTELRARDGPGSILCAVDGAPKSAPMMRWACDWAQATGSELRFIHAVHRVTDLPALKSERGLQEEARKDAEAAIAKQFVDAGIKAPLSVLTGDVGEVVRQEALRLGSELVLIGRGAPHGTLGRLRTHAYAIIRQSPCAVVSM